MKEVVKKEVLKLLDAGVIYLTSDSDWVSLVHVVSKKGGIAVLKMNQSTLGPSQAGGCVLTIKN